MPNRAPEPGPCPRARTLPPTLAPIPALAPPVQERGLLAALAEGRAVVVTHGDWDLIDQLPAECARKAIELPRWLRSFTDLKVVFAEQCSVSFGLGALLPTRTRPEP